MNFKNVSIKRGDLGPHERTRFATMALVLLLAFNVTSLLVYDFFTYRLQFHSDAAVKNLFAEEVLRQGTLFPADWAYVNGELLVFFGHLPIVPLLLVFENGFLLHAVSTSIFGMLLLASVWWLTGVLRLPRTIRLLGVCLFAGGISPVVTESVFGQVAYGPFTILLLVHIGLLIRLEQALQDTDQPPYIQSLLWLCAMSFIAFLASPARALITFSFPLSIAAATFAFHEALESGWMVTLKRNVVRHRMAVTAYVASCTFGAALHVYYLNRAISVGAGGKRSFVSPDQLPDKVVLLGQSLLALAGAAPVPGARIASLAGVDVLAHLLLFAVVFYCSFRLARTATGRDRSAAIAAGVANAFLALFAAVAFLYVFTDLSENVSTSRYFVPAFALGLVCMLIWLDRQSRRRIDLGVLVAAFCTLLVASLSFRIYLIPLYPYYRATAWHVALPAGRSEGLIRFLEDNDLHYGYASYWNAHLNTILSAGKVRIRPIVFRSSPPRFPRPMIQLAATHWYVSPPAVEEVFIMVDPNDAKAFDLATVERVTGPVRRTLKYESYTVYVFPGDFGQKVFGWDPTFARPATLHYDGTTMHQVGHPADDNAGLIASPGEVGFLVYGPYWDLMPGRYVAEFDLASCGTGTRILGEVDVSLFVGNRPSVIASAPIVSDAKASPLALPFDLHEATAGIEFRVRSNGSGCLRANGVRVHRVDIRAR